MKSYSDKLRDPATIYLSYSHMPSLRLGVGLGLGN